jgi:hypothetical protein
MRAVYRKRSGLWPEHEGQAVILDHHGYRMTLPVVEVLRNGGAEVECVGQTRIGCPIYDVTFRAEATVPQGIVAVHFNGPPYRGLRLDIEPEYPDEWPACWWEQADFLACPKCGAGLLWYEAGYAPGYRVCARPPHHHVMIQT